MEKILVLSDSHGNINNMMLAVKRCLPDRIIHLGDCISDAHKLHRKFPNIPMDCVPGNCDYEQDMAEQILDIEGIPVLICHGHSFNVKAGYLDIEMGALEMDVKLALFGHTHRVFYDRHNGLVLMNPGSIGSPPWGVPPSYGILQMDGDTGMIDMEIAYIE